jgi:hypothetical protein
MARGVGSFAARRSSAAKLSTPLDFQAGALNVTLLEDEIRTAPSAGVSHIGAARRSARYSTGTIRQIKALLFSCLDLPYRPSLCLTGFGWIGRDESAERDRLHQSRLAHKGLIKQIAHDFQQNSGVL